MANRIYKKKSIINKSKNIRLSYNKQDFDGIFCLHVASNHERYNRCMNEFKKVGIEDKVTFWWVTKSFLNVDAAKLYENDFRSHLAYRECDENVLGCVYSCSRGHYEIVKTSYERGLNNILIFEDDIAFTDKDSFRLLCDTMANVPNDYDCVKFNYYHGNDEGYNEEFKKELANAKDGIISLFFHPTPSCICYCLSRSGMLRVINEYEKQHTAIVADQIHWIMKTYAPTFDICNRIIDNNASVFTLKSSINC